MWRSWVPDTNLHAGFVRNIFVGRAARNWFGKHSKPAQGHTNSAVSFVPIAMAATTTKIQIPLFYATQFYATCGL